MDRAFGGGIGVGPPKNAGGSGTFRSSFHEASVRYYQSQVRRCGETREIPTDGGLMSHRYLISVTKNHPPALMIATDAFDRAIHAIHPDLLTGHSLERRKTLIEPSP